MKIYLKMLNNNRYNMYIVCCCNNTFIAEFCAGFLAESKCFVLYTDEELSYDDAVAKCQQNNGHLAYLKTRDLYDDIVNYIRAGIPDGYSDAWAWLGASYDVRTNYFLIK